MLNIIITETIIPMVKRQNPNHRNPNGKTLAIRQTNEVKREALNNQASWKRRLSHGVTMAPMT